MSAVVREPANLAKGNVPTAMIWVCLPCVSTRLFGIYGKLAAAPRLVSHPEFNAQPPDISKSKSFGILVQDAHRFAHFTDSSNLFQKYGVLQSSRQRKFMNSSRALVGVGLSLCPTASSIDK